MVPAYIELALGSHEMSGDEMLTQEQSNSIPNPAVDRFLEL